MSWGTGMRTQLGSQTSHYVLAVVAILAFTLASALPARALCSSKYVGHWEIDDYSKDPESKDFDLVWITLPKCGDTTSQPNTIFQVRPWFWNGTSYVSGRRVKGIKKKDGGGIFAQLPLESDYDDVYFYIGPKSEASMTVKITHQHIDGGSTNVTYTFRRCSRTGKTC
jgi:hypothetical protein